MSQIAATPFDQALGARIRALRVLQEYSQNKLASKVEISFQQLQKYEKGQNRISAHRLCLIAEALNVAPSELLTGLHPSMMLENQNRHYEAIPESELRLISAYKRINLPSTRRVVLELVRALAA